MDSIFAITFPLDFNRNNIIYHEHNISKMPDFDVFFCFVLECKNVKIDLILNVKMATEKRINTSLKDLFIALDNHGCHGLFSFKVPYLSQFYVI